MKRHEITTEDGFTRTDLSAVTGMLFLLLMLAMPMIRAVSGTPGEVCLDNQRQLVRAMLLYTADNSDFFPPVSDDGTIIANSVWISHNASIQSPLTDATNSRSLTNASSNMLLAYMPDAPRVFKCPADPTTIGTAKIPVVRSISINPSIGTDYLSATRKAPTQGYWLDGSHTHSANRTWRCYARLADVVNPRPSGLWMFLDEHPTSINDGLYATMGPTPNGSGLRYIDWPATYHENGAGFGFVDGHGEIKRWNAAPSSQSTPQAPTGPGIQQDLSWIAVRTTARVADQP